MHAHTAGTLAVASRSDEQHGTVVAPHDLAVQAGLAMYEQGGNAIDAAVAAALVSGVIEPTETTLAGSGFLVMAAAGEAPVEVDFGPTAPLAAHPSMFELADVDAGQASVLGLAPVVDDANVNGPRASGVPRTLLGLITAQERFGRLSRELVCRPAIEAAHTGFPAEAWFITAALSDIERLRSDPAASQTYLDEHGLPKGSKSEAGYGRSFDSYPLIQQAALGRTLEVVAQLGADVLMSGEVARAIVASSAERGGILQHDDLASAAPTVRTARLLRYRDAVVAGSHAPSGTATELQALSAWQHVERQGRQFNDSAALLRSMALTLRHAFADRYHWLGDSARRSIPDAELLSDAYARHIAELVQTGEDVPGWSTGAPWLTYAGVPVHDPWGFGQREGERENWRPSNASHATSGTTHISAADSEGRVVSITHTAANHFGSGIVCPRTGLLFDSAMAWFNAAPGAANSIVSGGRALANMGPLVVVGGDGTSTALGSSGGRRIVSALVQMVSSIVDGGCSAADAIAAPRLDASGRSLVLPEALASFAPELSDLDPLVVTQSNDPYPMDFSRPNVARYLGHGRTESAIAAAHHNA